MAPKKAVAKKVVAKKTVKKVIIKKAVAKKPIAKKPAAPVVQPQQITVPFPVANTSEQNIPETGNEPSSSEQS